jgi:hypothetical protein
MKDTCASFFLYLKGGLSREDFLGENVAVFVSVEITYEGETMTVLNLTLWYAGTLWYPLVRSKVHLL